MSRFEFGSFQERLEQRFDDVMNALKSILSHVSVSKNHHNAGISSKSGMGGFLETILVMAKTWNILRFLLLPIQLIDTGTKKIMIYA